MKFLSGKCFSIAVAAAFAVFAFTSATATAAVKEGKAVVQIVKGDAKYSTGGAWAALKAGMVLKPGAIIQTGADSSVELTLGINGEWIRVKPSTTVSIEKLTYEQTAADTVVETQLNLKAGGVTGKVRKTSAASRYEVKMPTGVAGIRGTTYDIDANGVVRVRDGCVVVVYVDANGQILSVEVCGGSKFVPGKGVQPMTPEEMASSTWNQGGGPTPPPAPGGPPIFVYPLISTPAPPGGGGGGGGGCGGP
ncbi:MAG: FecR domain-containing protein [Verrucomicrobia bacterium]|nr:FecR domain-containing protein [Verrucomicrobiota bacterium]